MIRLLMTIFLASTVLAGCTKSENEKMQSTKENSATGKVQSAKASPEKSIEQLVNDQVARTITTLNEESQHASTDGDYFKYTLNAKNIIKTDLNHDGRPDYVVEAHFCEEASCNMTTHLDEIFVFTTDNQNKINLIAEAKLGLEAKVTHIDQDGVISVTDEDYADNDPTCCPSITRNRSYALVGSKLRLLAD